MTLQRVCSRESGDMIALALPSDGLDRPPSSTHAPIRVACRGFGLSTTIDGAALKGGPIFFAPFWMTQNLRHSVSNSSLKLGPLGRPFVFWRCPTRNAQPTKFHGIATVEKRRSNGFWLGWSQSMGRNGPGLSGAGGREGTAGACSWVRASRYLSFFRPHTTILW